MILRLVLDVLKPEEPDIISFAQEIEKVPGVEGVSVVLYELDRKTETVKVILEGKGIDHEVLFDTLDRMGAVVHSIDEVSVGKRIVREVETPQDWHYEE